MDRETCERRLARLRAAYDTAPTTESRQDIGGRIMKLLLDFMEQDNIPDPDREWAARELAAFNQAQGRRQAPPTPTPEPPAEPRRHRNDNGRSHRGAESDEGWVSDPKHLRYRGRVEEEVPIEERRVHPDVWRWAIYGAKLGIAVIVLAIFVGAVSCSVWLWRGFWNSPPAIPVQPPNYQSATKPPASSPQPGSTSSGISRQDLEAEMAPLAASAKANAEATQKVAEALAKLATPRVIVQQPITRPPSTSPQVTRPTFSSYTDCVRWFVYDKQWPVPAGYCDAYGPAQ